jgi:hypothetical protein
VICTKLLTTVEEFETIQKGDILVVEWHRDSIENGKRTRFKSYEVVENLKERGQPEIVLEKKSNVYFNYRMFCDPSIGMSNAKTIMLVYQGHAPSAKGGE